MNFEFDVTSVASDQVNSVKGVLFNQWSEVKDYAEEEMDKIVKLNKCAKLTMQSRIFSTKRKNFTN